MCGGQNFIEFIVILRKVDSSFGCLSFGTFGGDWLAASGSQIPRLEVVLSVAYSAIAITVGDASIFVGD